MSAETSSEWATARGRASWPPPPPPTSNAPAMRPSALGAAAADLFVVVEHDPTRRRRDRVRTAQRARRGVAAGQIVEPAGDHELVAGAKQRGLLRVVSAQVEADHAGCGRRHAVAGELGCEQLEEVRIGPRLAQPEQRHHLRLRVELQAVGVDGSVQVDGQVRDAHQRPREVDQHAAPSATAVVQHDPAGDRQVAVQPGRQQQPAVGLDGELVVALGAHVGQGPQPQVGRVGVGTDQLEARLVGRLLADHEGRDARATADDEEALTGREPKGVGLVQLREASGDQPPDDLGDRVVGRR
jgi:hypothetical protein